MTIARLENWQLHFGSYGVRLTGQVYGHPSYQDGANWTTKIERYQIDPHSRTVATRTAIYRLGRPEGNERHNVNTETLRCEGCRKPMCLTCGGCSSHCSHGNPA